MLAQWLIRSRLPYLRPGRGFERRRGRARVVSEPGISRLKPHQRSTWIGYLRLSLRVLPSKISRRLARNPRGVMASRAFPLQSTSASCAILSRPMPNLFTCMMRRSGGPVHPSRADRSVPADPAQASSPVILLVQISSLSLGNWSLKLIAGHRDLEAHVAGSESPRCDAPAGLLLRP